MATSDNGKSLYGIWNGLRHEFQFGIAESSKTKAFKRLQEKIGRDAHKIRFETRRLPSSHEYVRLAARKVGLAPIEHELQEIMRRTGCKKIDAVHIYEQRQRAITEASPI